MRPHVLLGEDPLPALVLKVLVVDLGAGHEADLLEGLAGESAWEKIVLVWLSFFPFQSTIVVYATRFLYASNIPLSQFVLFIIYSSSLASTCNVVYEIRDSK